MALTTANAVIQTLGVQLSASTDDAGIVLSADPAIVDSGDFTYQVNGNVLSLSYTATSAHGSGAEATTFDLTNASYDTIGELATAISAWDPVAAGSANISAIAAGGTPQSTASALLSTTVSTNATGGALLNIGDPQANTDYALLVQLIDDVSAEIERATGRTFATGTLTEKYDGNGTEYLQLNSWPVDSITSVAVVSDDGTSTTLAASEYRADLTNGGLYRLSAEAQFWPWEDGPSTRRRRYPYWPCGFQNITVVYVAGYSDIPDDLERVAIQFVIDRYMRRKRALGQIAGSLDSSWTLRSEVDQAAYEHRLLLPFKRMVL